MKLIKAKIHHKRFFPKEYFFKASSFWFSLSRSEYLSKSGNFFLNIEKRGWYSFFSKDHFHWPKENNEQSIDQTLQNFLIDHGVTSPISHWDYFGLLKTVGYIFNPVCFFEILTEDNKKYAVVEVGNTFNELRPYFVDYSCFTSKGFTYKTTKNYYISPFVSADNVMAFNFCRNDKNIDISVKDYRLEGDLELVASLKGEIFNYSFRRLLYYTFRFPLITFATIFLIHWHAFVLWAKKIPYFKKNDQIHMQKGMQKWK